MAVRVSLAKGVDTDYLPRSAGKAGEQRQAGSYYISASAEGGEPPGRWWGKGAEALGFTPGAEVEREPYDQVFAERVSPLDGTKLGRRPGKREDVERLVHELRKSMPHATSEELHRIRVAAAQKALAGPLYIDMTSGFSKSVSLFHASLADNAARAEAAGDRAQHAFWSGQLEAMDEMIYAAVDAGFAYFQREAGYVRTGHHGGRVHGKDTGAWREADLVAVHWLQHTSRDEDPQLHVHGQILHAARSQHDGKWRAPDSRGYGEFTGAAGAIMAAHLEAAMTRRFGVEWVPRADGMGREIKGISQRAMDLFSTRRETITRNVRAWAGEYERTHGRKPTQRMLHAVARREHNATRHAKPEGKLDMRAMLATWGARLRGAGLGDLAQIAREVSALAGQRDAAAGREPTQEELSRAASQALELVQADRPTWTRADLIRCLGLAAPPSVQQLEPEAAAALLEALADQALASAFGGVACLEAPGLREVPAELTRADGRSVYQRHGGTRYALESHLASEAALVESAQAECAPSMTREECAQALGAEVAQLDAALTQRAQEAADASTGSGLRLDQAAALYRALTSDRTVEIVTGPAGSGKTRTLAEAARIWPGDVIGITPSSSSREVLAAASGAECYNSAQFLGHLREGRGLLGVYEIAPGTLILLDEASMLSQADIADIVAWARARGGKVLMSGDQEQLTAVEGGGGMALVASNLGYGQLLIPGRFTAEWEQDASLRLRAGDASILPVYDQHGRISGDDAEHVLDEAVRRYVGHYLTGADVLMMAASHEDCRELGRRVRDDLMHLGLVDGGASAAIGGGARASAGDLIRVTANDRMLIEPGRTLLNGDTLQVTGVNDDGSLRVRRAVDADEATGQRRYASAFTLPAKHVRVAEPAYAVTTHSAQGRTVAYGLAVIRGSEDREWTYVALSRGSESNAALVATPREPANLSDVARPAPELPRHDRLEAERAGLPVDTQRPDSTVAALGVLAGNLERQGRPLAALDYQRQELADADHLGALRVIFENETAGPRADRYAGMFRDALTAAEYPHSIPKGHTDRWLWRTLESAELAGLDPRGLLDRALAQGPLDGARDVVSVLTARVRSLAGPMVPQPGGRWADRVPQMPTPALQVYLEGVAADMDERTGRLGPFTAESAPAWAVAGLGPVPDDPAERLDWERRAAAVAAYREAYSYEDAADPAGPEPEAVNPRQRAMWHEAMTALGPVDGIDVRGMRDPVLLNARAVFERETAWAPRYVADELRQVRRGAIDAELRAVRADAEAQLARDQADAERAGRHEQLAVSHRAAERFYRGHAEELAEQMQVREEWEQATEYARRTAQAADTEYRRRHPETGLEPLRNAEPEPVSEDERAQLEPGEDYQRPGWLDQLAERRREAAAELADRRSMRVSHEDPDYGESLAWPEAERQRDAVWQAPQPQMQSAAALDREAGE